MGTVCPSRSNNSITKPSLNSNCTLKTNNSFIFQENQKALSYNFAKEILITKTELEKKNSLIEELKQKVDESKTECTYQLRLYILTPLL